MNFKTLFALITIGFVTASSGQADYCSSDYDCNSLCCNNGRCQTVNYDEGLMCNKSSGQSCISSEFCQMSYINICKVYKIGVTPDGQAECSIQCFPEEVESDCINGLCHRVEAPEVEIINCEDAPSLSSRWN